MNWKECARKRSGTIPSFAWKELPQDSRRSGQDLNPGPHEYEARVLATRSRHYSIFLQSLKGHAGTVDCISTGHRFPNSLFINLSVSAVQKASLMHSLLLPTADTGSAFSLFCLSGLIWRFILTSVMCSCVPATLFVSYKRMYLLIYTFVFEFTDHN
jgi:hypothetical protein